MMYGHRKSDPGIVATKSANNAEPFAAEPVEPRTGTKGNVDRQSTRQAQDWESVSQALARIRQAARVGACSCITTISSRLPRPIPI